MTFYPPDILEKSRPLMLLKSIIGGLECEPSSRIMYIKGCSICQQFKINQNPSAPSFNPIPRPTTTWPFANLSMDLITNLPPITLNNGTIVDAILSVVDHGLTKGVILTPCSKTLTEEGTGEILLHHIYKRFRLPNNIISDRDPQFTTKSFHELLKLLGIKLKLMTAYWPQSDRTTECCNQEIEAYIGIYCSSNPKTWHKSISTMEFTHNNQRHSDRQWTPFELMIGTSPLAIPTTFEHTKFPSVEEWVQQLMKDREEAITAHELAQQCMAKQHKNKFSGFKLDQLVWLDTWNLKTKYHKKMAPKKEGPFRIFEVLRLVTYQLDLPPTWQIHNIFHAVLLMPYIENEVHRLNFLWPPPDIKNDKEWWEIKAILNHQWCRWGYQYYVLWKGWPITNAMWEPTMCFENGGKTILQEYQHQLHL